MNRDVNLLLQNKYDNDIAWADDQVCKALPEKRAGIFIRQHTKSEVKSPAKPVPNVKYLKTNKSHHL